MPVCEAIACHSPFRAPSNLRTSVSSAFSIPRKLAKLCSDGKQHFAHVCGHSRRMPEKTGKSINQVVAENLAHWMEQAGFTSQQALADKSGVSQRTIANYLKPGLRDDTSSGKEPSAKVTELQKLADALHIEVWQLMRAMTPQEREFYAHIEEAYKRLAHRQQSEEELTSELADGPAAAPRKRLPVFHPGSSKAADKKKRED